MTDDTERYIPINICQHCGHENRPGALMCEKCNKMILSGTPNATKRLEDEEADQVEHDPAQAAELARQSVTFPADAVLSIKFKEMQQPLNYPIDKELLIGRYDKRTGTSPDIDMHPFAGYLLGVSRLHARFVREEERLLLEDLGSNNGTFLNNRKLSKNQRIVVPEKSVVRLGQLSFTVYFKTT